MARLLALPEPPTAVTVVVLAVEPEAPVVATAEEAAPQPVLV